MTKYDDVTVTQLDPQASGVWLVSIAGVSLILVTARFDDCAGDWRIECRAIWHPDVERRMSTIRTTRRQRSRVILVHPATLTKRPVRQPKVLGDRMLAAAPN